MRREFITLIGGAAAWPGVGRAQQPAMPVIGFLDPRSPDAMRDRLRGFRQGLKETGYAEEENVTIVYRRAENHVDRLPALANDMVSRKVTVIIASGGPGAIFVAKAASTTILLCTTQPRRNVRVDGESWWVSGPSFEHELAADHATKAYYGP